MFDIPYIEKDCIFTHQGKEFESGGAIITDGFIVGYCSSNMKTLTTWHGEFIGHLRISSSWKIKSYITDRYYQVWTKVNGQWYTGRTAGAGMIAKLRKAKTEFA